MKFLEALQSVHVNVYQINGEEVLVVDNEVAAKILGAFINMEGGSGEITGPHEIVVPNWSTLGELAPRPIFDEETGEQTGTKPVCMFEMEKLAVYHVSYKNIMKREDKVLPSAPEELV